MIDMESNAHLDVIGNRTKLETWRLKTKGLGSGKNEIELARGWSAMKLRCKKQQAIGRYPRRC